MFTKQPEYVVLRAGAIVFHGTEIECHNFALWCNREYQTDEYRMEARRNA